MAISRGRWFVIGIFASASIVGIALFTGKVRLLLGSFVRRETDAQWYWSIIAIYSLLGLGCVYGAIKSASEK
ncbi:hypothetical protein [Sphingomonas sp. PWP1-2]|uniref:hypothetical protein n=1 Tax=Sphingomonas sp. PWP1-2 TaxID=2804558 RepID=UPI003CF76D47